MKRQIKIFNKLSAKQIKTHAAVILIASLSFDTLASAGYEDVSYDVKKVVAVETNLDEELKVEN